MSIYGNGVEDAILIEVFVNESVFDQVLQESGFNKKYIVKDKKKKIVILIRNKESADRNGGTAINHGPSVKVTYKNTVKGISIQIPTNSNEKAKIPNNIKKKINGIEEKAKREIPDAFKFVEDNAKTLLNIWNNTDEDECAKLVEKLVR